MAQCQASFGSGSLAGIEKHRQHGAYYASRKRSTAGQLLVQMPIQTRAFFFASRDLQEEIGISFVANMGKERNRPWQIHWTSFLILCGMRCFSCSWLQKERWVGSFSHPSWKGSIEAFPSLHEKVFCLVFSLFHSLFKRHKVPDFDFLANWVYELIAKDT